jgi:hypothetical protein
MSVCQTQANGQQDRSLANRIAEDTSIRAKYVFGAENPEQVEGTVPSQGERIQGHDGSSRQEKQADGGDDDDGYWTTRHDGEYRHAGVVAL